MSIETELAALRKMSPKAFRAKYAELFGEESRSGNREFLFKRVAWRIQSLAFGGLSERARRRAEMLARDSDVRTTAPPTLNGRTHTAPAPTTRDPRLPLPGTVIERPYKGGLVRVIVRENDFEYEGETFRSLSAIARKVTRSHVNGMQFFRLGSYAT